MKYTSSNVILLFSLNWLISFKSNYNLKARVTQTVSTLFSHNWKSHAPMPGRLRFIWVEFLIVDHSSATRVFLRVLQFSSLFKINTCRIFSRALNTWYMSLWHGWFWLTHFVLTTLIKILWCYSKCKPSWEGWKICLATNKRPFLLCRKDFLKKTWKRKTQ